MTARPMCACCPIRRSAIALILLNGWSKTYAMTGWRLGYAVWPGKLYDYARKLAVNLHSCVNAAAQYAGLAALTGPQDAVYKMVAEFDRRRKVVVDGLNRLPGISCATPKGAFYAFPNVKRTGWKAKPLAVLAARGRRRRHHRRARLRHSRRGLCAAFLRQFHREHRARARPHGRLPRQPQGGVARADGRAPRGSRRRDRLRGRCRADVGGRLRRRPARHRDRAHAVRHHVSSLCVGGLRLPAKRIEPRLA